MEAWNAFRQGETLQPEPQTLPCVGCDLETTEANSVPDYFGDCSCPAFTNEAGVTFKAISVGTMCLSCKTEEE